MPDRLTKAQVEALLVALDGPTPQLVEAIGTAVAVLHPGEALDAVLRRLGRDDDADRLLAAEPDAAWALATELNERRHL